MTQEHKSLLLKDICARLPYKTKVELIEYSDFTKEKLPAKIGILDYLTLGKVQAFCKGFRLTEVKPYLFPLSSMTEEQKEEFNSYFASVPYYGDNIHIHYYSVESLIDFYNKHHLDWRGLIPMGLAIDATGKNIY